MDGLPVLRLLCPFRLFLVSLGFRWGLPYLLSTPLIIPQEASRVRCVGLKQNDLGGVFLPVLTALCGSSVVIQGMSGLPVFPRYEFPILVPWFLLCRPRLHFGFD